MFCCIAAPCAGSLVCGVIDGKFDGGYLITVGIGSEEFKGVLYQVPESEQGEAAKMFSHSLVKAGGGGGVPRRKRRKKSEIRRRDPAHPKPNRSGYNFFFAEQHAKLKPLYHGKDREISRIIGESWNKLQQQERVVYQEKALKDKERYKVEMEGYRERLRLGQIVQTAAAPLQAINPSSNGVGSASAYADENEASAEDKSDKSNLEEYGSSPDKGSQGDMNLKNVNVEMMANEAFDLQTQPDRVGWDENRMWLAGDEKNVVPSEGGISVRIQEGERLP